LQTAEELLRELLRDNPSPGFAANWIRILGLQLRFPDALAAIQQALAAYPEDRTLQALGPQLRNAEMWVGGADSDPLRTGSARALLWLYFGSIPLAQAELAPLQRQHPGAIETVIMTKLVEAALGRVHESREFFLNQRLADTANLPAYEWGLGQILLVTAANQAPVVAGSLDTLMR
jgi:hypothetical protein